MRKLCFALLVLLVANPLLAGPDPVKRYRLEEQAKAADLVAIIEPISSASTKDPFPEPGLGSYIGVNTVFKLVAVLKGQRPRSENLTLLHFREPRQGETPPTPVDAEPRRVIVNAPQFSYFSVIEEVGEMQLRSRGQWLAFLRKRADGRDEAVVDQYTMAQSFHRMGVTR